MDTTRQSTLIVDDEPESSPHFDHEILDLFSDPIDESVRVKKRLDDPAAESWGGGDAATIGHRRHLDRPAGGRGA